MPAARGLKLNVELAHHHSLTFKFGNNAFFQVVKLPSMMRRRASRMRPM